MYPQPLQQLIEELKKLPGVGNKTAERYAFELLDRSEEECDAFAQSIINAKTNIKECDICHYMSVEATCPICLDNRRDKSIICVVSYPKDLMAIEKTNQYHGTYHVLHGVISTTKGIMPEDIKINSLFNRINETVKEVIIATNPTIEGETTALYIAKKLEAKNIAVTRLAAGLPMGGLLDYADEMTLTKAMEGRKKIL